jgi:E3 ubiquitin-protein ligase RNF13
MRPAALAALLLLAAGARGTVLVRDEAANSTLLTAGSLPAAFGPRVPRGGVAGALLAANPLDACARLRAPPPAAGAWIALIARSDPGAPPEAQCGFAEKVARAAAAGAAAAVVFDSVPEALLPMGRAPGAPAPGVPAVLVSLASGREMMRLLAAPGGGGLRAVLTPGPGAWLEVAAAAAGGFAAAAALAGAFLAARRAARADAAAAAAAAAAGAAARRAPAGLSPAQLAALPVVLHGGAAPRAEARSSSDESEEGGGAGGSGAGAPLLPRAAGHRAGGTRAACAVCLCAYELGEKVAVLPCRHRYHAQCVKQWLANRVSCPVCKLDVAAALAAAATGPADADVEAAAGAEPAGAGAAASAARGWWAFGRGGAAAAAPPDLERPLLAPPAPTQSRAIPAATARRAPDPPAGPSSATLRNFGHLGAAPAWAPRPRAARADLEAGGESEADAAG